MPESKPSSKRSDRARLFEAATPTSATPGPTAPAAFEASESRPGVCTRRDGICRRTAHSAVSALLLSLAVVAGLTQSGCTADRDSPSAGRPVAERGDGYVTSDACHACHPAEHASWSDSFHRRMTQLPSDDAVLAPFRDNRVEVAGQRFVLGREGDAFVVTDQGGRTREVVMTTGAHHFQAYWYSTGHGRELALFPFMFKVAEQRWLPFNALVLTPPSHPQHTAGGEWNEVCVACHSVRGRPRVSSEAPPDTRVAELGIACESCHGPGAEHVRVNRDPLRRWRLRLAGGADDTIVNPARLSPLRSAQVCGQCHAVQGLGDWERWLADGAPFLPGEDLFARRVQRHADEPGSRATRFWPDGRVRVGGREYPGITESACFASGELDCTTCHRLHQSPDDERPASVWADDQLAPGMRGDTACVGCHPAYADETTLAAHTHHGVDSPGSRCMACHMPKNAFGLHKATRSHHIASPSVEETVEAGRPNACSLCHLDRTLAWAADRLEAWYGAPRPDLDERARTLAVGPAWVLAGDANQRALAGWHMGDAAAQKASGTEWMAPYLAHLLRDPYEANRAVALAALRTLPGFEGHDIDYVAAWPNGVAADALGIQRAWLAGSATRAGAARPELLLLEDGTLDVSAAARLTAERDTRPIYLAE